MLATTIKPDTWTSRRRHGRGGSLLIINSSTCTNTDLVDYPPSWRHECTIDCRFNLGASQGPRSAAMWGGVAGLSQGYCLVSLSLSYCSSNHHPPLRHFPVARRIHICHNHAELPCQRRRVNPAALSCSCLSVHRRAASCHHCSQKIRCLCIHTEVLLL